MPALIPSAASVPVESIIAATASQPMPNACLLGNIIDTLHHLSSTSGRPAQPRFVPRQGFPQAGTHVVGRIVTQQTARLADIGLRMADVPWPESLVDGRRDDQGRGPLP